MKRITTIFLIVLSGHLSMIAQTDTTAYSAVSYTHLTLPTNSRV